MFLMSLALLQMAHPWAQPPTLLFASAARIDQQDLSRVMEDPRIRSFDLSPDGRVMAFLAVAGLKVGAPLSVLLVDIDTKKIVGSRELGPSASTSVGGTDFREQVVYSSDQQYLVVQDLHEIRVLDARTLETARTIGNDSLERGAIPLRVLGASKSDVFACAFGAVPQPAEFQAFPVQVAVVDVSTGKILGRFGAEDVPQTISPNGDLLAISSWRGPRRGVVPLQVFDRNGQKVAELADGFSFREDAGPSKPLGRVQGRFLSNEEIIVSPDEHFDTTGHLSGDSLRVLTILGNQSPHDLTPRHYMPQGEMVVSADGRTVLVTNWYVPARILAQPHGVIPPSSGPEVLILQRDGMLHVASTLPAPGLGQGFLGRLSTQTVRLSSDGSVLAIAQDRGITVLTRNTHP